MPGILDFLTDVGGDRALSGEFVAKIANPSCTRDDLLAFFQANNYPDVTAADVDKLLAQKANLKQEFDMPEGVDY